MMCNSLLIFNLYLMRNILAATYSWSNIPNFEITQYKGEILCDSQITTTNSPSNNTNYKFDAWVLNMDDSFCINILANTNMTINNYSHINLFDCNGFLVDLSNDYLASNKCKFKYVLQFVHLKQYTLKISCNDNEPCDNHNTMRRLKSVHVDYDKDIIGYLRQGINLRMLAEESDESDELDESSDSHSQDDTSTPTSKNPSKYPSRYPSRYPSKNPSKYPSKKPSKYPTSNPSKKPSKYPSRYPSRYPTSDPTKYPLCEADDCV
eukprot:439093_1